jgi:hypothetical protein
MERTIVILVAFVLTALPAWAGQMAPVSPNQSPAMKNAPAQPETREVEGKIKNVDQSGRRVILEDGTALTIPDALKTKLPFLRSGATVRATYKDMGGDKVAMSLEVRSEAQKSKS